MKLIQNHTGAQTLIGYAIEIDKGSARAVLDLDERHLNRTDSLHGGLMATLLDAASGYTASLSVDGETLPAVATVSMTVNYLSGVRSGRVIATAKKTGGGRKLIFVDAQLAKDDGTLIATSTGTFKLLS
tara:strand:+ start:86156 stop:86542 length:387 start_codon:yes stop_codon:yes gene_type:complete